MDIMTTLQGTHEKLRGADSGFSCHTNFIKPVNELHAHPDVDVKLVEVGDHGSCLMKLLTIVDCSYRAWCRTEKGLPETKKGWDQISKIIVLLLCPRSNPYFDSDGFFDQIKFQMAMINQTNDFKTKGTNYYLRTLHKRYSKEFRTMLDSLIRKMRVIYLWMFGHSAAA